MTQIATHFDTPVAGIDRFCDLSGMTKATRIEEGRIPVLPKQGEREVVMVNLMALAMLGAEHVKEHVAARKPGQPPKADFTKPAADPEPVSIC